MQEPSVHAVLCDLVGPEPDPQLATRPSLAAAARRCPPGAIVAARHRDRPMAVAVLADGRVVAVPDHCPHQGALLSEGFVDGERLVCPRHNWEFDAATGQCSHDPALVLPVRHLAQKRRKRADS